SGAATECSKSARIVIHPAGPHPARRAYRHRPMSRRRIARRSEGSADRPFSQVWVIFEGLVRSHASWGRNMGTASAKGPSKTAFVRNFIRTNSTANRKAVEEAWWAAGHEGPISSSLVSNLRTELGLTGKKPGGSQPTSGPDAVGSVKVTSPKPKKRRRRA